MNFSIRQAVLEDGPYIAQMNSQLAAETEGLRLDPEVITAGVLELLQSPERGRYFVACQGQQIIGQLMHTSEWSDWRNGEIWWLQSVYVRPEFRRQGVFRGLLEHVMKLSHQTPGVIGLRLYVEQHNEAAHAVYQNLGFKKPGYLVLELLSPKVELQRLD